MNEAAPAVAQLVVLEAFDQDLTLPTDDTPVFTVLLPLLVVLAVYLATVIIAVLSEPRLPLGDGLGLGGGEEDVQRLTKADSKANECHQGHVQRAGLDLLEVLPVHIAPLGGFFQGPLGGMAKSTHTSTERTLLLLEARGGSVGLGRALRLGGGHACRPSVVRLVLNTSHVTRNDLTSLVPSQRIRRSGHTARVERSRALKMEGQRDEFSSTTVGPGSGDAALGMREQLLPSGSADCRCGQPLHGAGTSSSCFQRKRASATAGSLKYD